MFLRRGKDKIVFSSLIAFNGMCDNLLTHHYHITYHPCFDTQFQHTFFALLPCQFSSCEMYIILSRVDNQPISRSEINYTIFIIVWWVKQKDKKLLKGEGCIPLNPSPGSHLWGKNWNDWFTERRTGFICFVLFCFRFWIRGQCDGGWECITMWFVALWYSLFFLLCWVLSLSSFSTLECS